MNKELLYIFLTALLVSLSFNIGVYVGEKNQHMESFLQGKESGYREVFYYGFSDGEKLRRTEYYGTTFITMKLLDKNCLPNDYLDIYQDCEKSDVNVATGETEDKK